MKRGQTHEKPTFDSLLRKKSGDTAPTAVQDIQDSEPTLQSGLNGEAGVGTSRGSSAVLNQSGASSPGSRQRQQPKRKGRAKPASRPGAGSGATAVPNATPARVDRDA